MEFKFDGVIVTTNLDDLTESEIKNYIDYVRDNKPSDDPLKSVDIKLCDDGKIDVDYTLQGKKFERIRRITGKKIAACC